MVLTYQLKYKQLSSADYYQSVKITLRDADFDTEDQLQSGVHITPLLVYMPEAVCSFEDQEASVGVQKDVGKFRAYFWVHGNVGMLSLHPLQRPQERMEELDEDVPTKDGYDETETRHGTTRVDTAIMRYYRLFETFEILHKH
jgi:hypothetical protein